MEDAKNNYLSSWIEGEITDEELKKYITEEEFLSFQKLNIFLDSVEVKDSNIDESYNSIKEKLELKRKQKRNLLKLFRYTAVAASIVLFFGIFKTFYFSNSVNVKVGSKKVLVLKDKSEVIISSQSTLSYPSFFKLNRTLKLEGEAFFKVEKGNTFTVKTKMGSVTVLGTKFNVISYDNYFEVVCYEGKVSVKINNKKYILTAKEHLRFYDGNYENWVEEIDVVGPKWIHAESSFKSVPVKYVIANFEMQYGVKINYPNKYEKIKFSGSFTHNDIDIALKSIFTPLNLTYSNNGIGNIVVSE